MTFTCPSCHSNEGIFDVTFGILPCKSCQERQSTLKTPNKQIEFTSDSIKQQRKEYAKDIEQDHRKGELNKAWLDTYGKESALRRGYTPQEIKKAKYVYDGKDSNNYYDKGNK